MAFGWFKKILGKSSKNNDMQIDSVYENPFYEAAETEAVNPFYNDEDDLAPSYAENTAAYSNEGASESVGSATPEYEIWQMQNIGGLPTMESIEKMAGGLKMDKIGKHKNVKMALDALANYQRIMEESHDVHIDAKKIAMENKSYNESEEDKMFDASSASDAFRELGTFIVYANKVVTSANGLFSSRSSNIQKLAPIFANLIVRANGLLPKISHLETAVASYVISTDKMSFTFSDLINHETTGNRSGGLAMRGIESDNASIDLSPEEIIETLKNVDTEKQMDAIREQRRQKTVLAREGLKIPNVPVGFLKEQLLQAATDEKREDVKRSAQAIVDAYFAELRPLLTAIEDAAESYEGFGVNERSAVREEQMRNFWVNRFLQRILLDKESMINVVLNGFPAQTGAADQYDDIRMLYRLGGRSLATASAFMQNDAMDESKYMRLIDGEGNSLEENKKDGYKISGGNASVAILDFHNKKVLRSPKNLSLDEQKVAFNGIHDEAVAKVGQFLGFDVMANAKAGGFFSKEKGDSKETARFGGSVMDLAKGTEAKQINLLLAGETEDDIVKRRQTKDYKNIDISKNGRFVEDMMKMSIVDYITLHADRHGGNFLINADATEGESMVTGIDNDMVFGHNDASNETGFQNSATALKGINRNTTMQYGASVPAVLAMVTENIKTKIENWDIEQFNQMLMPYVDRVRRLAAVHRAQELKEYIKTVEVCDFSTSEGIMKYLKKSNQKAVEEWVRGMYMNGKSIENDIYDTIKTPILRMLLESHGAFSKKWGSPQQTILAMKIAGFEKQEAMGLIEKNVSVSKNEVASITKEQFKASNYYKVFEDYDLPMNEFRKKYNFT